MNLLIDSSTSYLFLALETEDSFYHFERSGRFDHSESLTDFLDKFLKEHNVSYNDIKNIYVGRGPGSYTGIRISGVVAKVLSYATSAKLFSFSSLDIALACHMNDDGKYISLTEAKKNAYYVKAITVENGLVHIDLDESFAEQSDIEKYADYIQCFINDELFEHAFDIYKNIVEKKLYQEEDNLNYSPNYLRSVI